MAKIIKIESCNDFIYRRCVLLTNHWYCGYDDDTSLKCKKIANMAIIDPDCPLEDYKEAPTPFLLNKCTHPERKECHALNGLICMNAMVCKD